MKNEEHFYIWPLVLISIMVILSTSGSISWLWTILVGVLGLMVMLVPTGMRNNKEELKRKQEFEEKKNQLLGFKISKEVLDINDRDILLIDFEGKQIAILGIGNESRRYAFNKILGAEIVEEGDVGSKKSTGSIIGRAIIGGIVTGGVGAIVGGLSASSKEFKKVNKVMLKLNLQDLNQPAFFLTLYNKSNPKTAGYSYEEVNKEAKEINDLFTTILAEGRSENAVDPQNGESAAEKLRELKTLLEEGVLTDEEFSAAKKKILKI